MDGVTGEPTKQVHVFADKWALQGDGYVAVTFAKGRYGPRTYVRQLVHKHCLLFVIYLRNMILALDTLCMCQGSPGCRTVSVTALAGRSEVTKLAWAHAAQSTSSACAPVWQHVREHMMAVWALA